MDSEIQRDGRVLDLTDDAWREDRLPYEDVTIPLVNAETWQTTLASAAARCSQSLFTVQTFLTDILTRFGFHVGDVSQRLLLIQPMWTFSNDTNTIQ